MYIILAMIFRLVEESAMGFAVIRYPRTKEKWWWCRKLDSIERRPRTRE